MGYMYDSTDWFSGCPSTRILQANSTPTATLTEGEIQQIALLKQEMVHRRQSAGQTGQLSVCRAGG